MIHNTTKVSEELNRKFPAKNKTYNFQSPISTLRTTIHIVTDRRTDRQRQLKTAIDQNETEHYKPIHSIVSLP